MRCSQLPKNQRAHLSSSRFFVLLVLLPLSLAAIAFVLEWRGRVYDPVSRLQLDDLHQYFGRRRTSSKVSASSKDSYDQVFGHSSTPAFSYFRLWTFDHGHDYDHPTPKICITTSTSIGLEQILPWIYFHKVIGVGTFFFFVEGKAASPYVSLVLESIAEGRVIRTLRELEGKQAQRGRYGSGFAVQDVIQSVEYELQVMVKVQEVRLKYDQRELPELRKLHN